MKTIRIFISSPGDVQEERLKAQRVIADLQRNYASQASLQPVLWEDLALPATASFQESIDYLLGQKPIDVAVFILWSRLGSPLGTSIRRPDGSPYRSGTEREFDLMLTAFQQSGRQRPLILAYARDDEATWKKSLSQCEREDLEEVISQQQLAESFIKEQFHDQDGHNFRAYHAYREPVGFAQRLRTHLRSTLDDLLVADATTPRWTEPPYRSLEVFDIQHAPIFFGRSEESCDVMDRLRRQHDAGCGFVVIVGASGSGKSSLARAGVAASLVDHAYDEQIRAWRWCVFVPAVHSRGLLIGLTKTLCDAVPELLSSGTSINDIATSLAKDADLTSKLTVLPALTRADEQAGGEVRVLIVLDQMEELWTDRTISDEDREQFLSAIEALAQTHRVDVVATLRSDFYAQAQSSETFLRLKGEAGHVDLVAPGTAALQRMIVEPARMAGLQFEREERTGKTLDQTILEDAARDPSALPLVQYALAELYDQRNEAARVLTFAAYEEMGGVEGAIGQRAAATYAKLPEATQAALNEILPLLVTVDTESEQNAVRRRASMDDLTATPNRKVLTESLIAARFLTTDRDGEQSIASLTHEALLRRWSALSQWVNTNRDHLRLRARIEQNQQRWEQAARDSSMLLSSGLPLEEGRQLLDTAREFLTPSAASYVEASILHQEAEQRRRTRRRYVVLSALSLLTIFAIAVGVYSWRQRNIADQKSKEASAESEKARTAESKARAAEQAAVTARERSEATLARSNYFLAIARLDADRFEEGCELLDRIPPEYRQLEWRLARRQFVGEYMSCYGHTRGVTSVSFSPDGTRIVSGSTSDGTINGTIKLWDSATGEELRTLNGHTNYDVNSVSFSPDGAWIVSGHFDSRKAGEIKLWDAATGEEMRTLKGHTGRINSVSFSPDGTRIVSGSGDHTIKLWDVVTGEDLRTFDATRSVTSVRFSPDGKRIVSNYSTTSLKLWDAATGEELRTLKGHRGSVNGVSFSPDGLGIVSGSTDGTLKLWDAATGKEMRTFNGHTDGVDSVSFSPDGARVVSTSSDNTLKLWNASTGQELRTFKGHTKEVTSASFSPDGARVVSGSSDGTLKIWDVINEPWTLKGHTGRVTSVSFSPDGAWIVSGDVQVFGPGEIKLWDTATGADLRTLKGHRDSVTSVSFSPDGTRIVSGSSRAGPIKLWDAATGEELRTFDAPFGVNHFTKTLNGLSELRTSDVNGGDTSVNFSPDGTRLASGTYSVPTLKLWDAGTGEELWTFDVTGSVNSVSFSPDGAQIIGMSSDRTIKKWNAASGEKLRDVSMGLTGEEVHALRDGSGEVSLSFSPDGARIVSGSLDGTLRVRDAATGEELRTLKGHRGSVNGVSFSPDGLGIVSGSTDGTLKLWDAATGKEMRTFNGHTDGVNSVSFSPDGTRIVSGSGDDTLKLWDAATGQELRTFKGHTDSVTSVSFSPDGTQIVSGSSRAGQIKLWDAATGEELRTFDPAGGVASVGFSPDGTRLLCLTYSVPTLKLWDPATGEGLQTLNGLFACVSFSPDGAQIVTASRGTIKKWDTATGKELRTLKPSGIDIDLFDSWGVSFSPDSSQIVSATRGGTTLTLWNAATGEELWDAPMGLTGEELDALEDHPEVPVSLSFSPDGARIISGNPGGTFRLWDAATGEELRTLKGHTDRVSSVSVSPDGARIVSGSLDGTLKLWDAATEVEMRTLRGHSDYVRSVSVSPDGARIVSGSHDGTLKLWDTATGQELRALKAHTDSVTSVSFSPDGTRIVSGSTSDGTIKLWDAATGEELRPKDRLALSNRLSSGASFSPDGTKIVTGNGDGTLELWDASSGEKLRTLKGHWLRVSSVSFSPDGTRIVSGSYDKTLKLWDEATGEELWTLKGHTRYVTSTSFSPDGQRVYSRSWNNVERFVWDIETGNRLESEPWQDFEQPERVSDDGRWLAIPYGNNVSLVDLKFKNRPDEKALRISKAKLNPVWHREQAELAEKARDWYAATFHRAWVMKADPKAGNDAEMLRTDYEKLKAAYGGQNKQLEPYLQPIVLDVLGLSSGLRAESTRVQSLDLEVRELADEGRLCDAIRQLEGMQQLHSDAGDIVPLAIDWLTPSWLSSFFAQGADEAKEVANLAQVKSLNRLTLKPLVRLLIGENALVDGETEAAIEQMRRAITDGGDQLYFFKSLGWALTVAGDDAEAATALTRALQKSTDGASDGEEVERDEMDHDQWTAAYFLRRVATDEYVSRWVTDDPDTTYAAFVWFYVGQRHEIDGNVDTAEQAYRKSIELAGTTNLEQRSKSWSTLRLMKLAESKPAAQ